MFKKVGGILEKQNLKCLKSINTAANQLIITTYINCLTRIKLIELLFIKLYEI